MAGRAACCSALQRLPLTFAAVSGRPASSSSLPFLRISRSSGQRRRAFKLRIHGMCTESKLEPAVQSKEDESPAKEWKIKMLYDGECPLCMREVVMLKERNESYGAIKFVDISSEDYSPEDNQGLDYRTVMGRIHAILSDGTVVTDVEAFRRLYEEVGLGWVYAVTRYEPVSTIANAVYSVWAKYRLQITGRPPMEEILLSRKGDKAPACSDNGDNEACKM